MVLSIMDSVHGEKMKGSKVKVGQAEGWNLEVGVS